MNSLLSCRLPGKAAARSGFFALCAGLAGIAAGQGLPSVPGLTVLQQPVADTLQSVCIKLNGLDGGPVLAPPNPNGTPSERLSNSCSKMVVSSFGNQGAQVPEQFNLKISNSQIGTGVQAIAPVQANAQKQLSTEASKAGMIGSRLLNVRGGSRGMVVGLNGQEVKSASAAAVKGTRPGRRHRRRGERGWHRRTLGRLRRTSRTAGATSTRRRCRMRTITAASACWPARITGSTTGSSSARHSATATRIPTTTGGLGKVKAATTGLVGYGTYYVDDFYVDGLLGYGWVDYDTTRNIYIPSNNPAAAPINATATASPKGRQFSAALGVGRNYAMGTYTITPSARLGYIWVKNKAFSESEPVEGLALAVSERTITSLQTALGARVSGVVNTASGVFGPYFSAHWMHEFQNDSPSILSKYVADPTNQFFAIPTAGGTPNYAVLALGSHARRSRTASPDSCNSAPRSG